MSTPSGAARDQHALVALVAVLAVVTLDLVRASGPLVDLALTEGGVPAATVAALAAYLLPGLVVPLLLAGGRARPARAPLLTGSALLAALRLVAQALDGGARFLVGLAAVGVAVALLTLAVAALAARPGGGRTTAAALAAGAAAVVGLQLTLGTWDALWRHTLLGWVVAALLAAALLASAVLASRGSTADPPTTGGPRRLWVLGPGLALAAMMLANPAFAASQSGLPLALAGPVHAAGLLLAAWTVGRGSGAARWFRPLAALVLVVGVAVGLSRGSAGPADGVAVLLALLAAQVAAANLAAAALEPVGAPRGRARTAGTAAVVGVSTIVPLLAYQLDYDVPLGVPNELVLVLTAVALGLAGRGTRSPATAPTRPGPLLAAAGAVVVLGAVVAVAGAVLARPPAASAAGPAGSGVVLSWNLHYGVSPVSGGVDLESVARTIEAEDPDVVLLQEVSRGWVQGGGADTATWLSQRLQRPFVFAPAADRRFGNVVSARERPARVQVHRLPYGAGPQQRSAVSADVRVGGRTVRATSVHLQQRATNTATRLEQLDVLLPALAAAGAPAEVLAGDLNAVPGGPEVAAVARAGFVSAVDAVGDPAALTSPVPEPRRRIDWVFGRGVAFAGARVLTGPQASDHLPVVVTLAP